MLRVLLILSLLHAYIFAKNVLILNAYSATFPWTLSQSNSIVSELNQHKDIHTFVEFMDTKQFKPTVKRDKYLLDYYTNKYHDTVFDAIVTTDDNAINFIIKHQNEKIFKNIKVFFSGVNNLKLQNTLDKSQFTGVFEVKNPIINLQIAKQLNKNLKTIYLIGDNSTTSIKNIEQYKKSLSEEKKIKFIYLNYSDIQSVTEKLQNYDKDSVMMLMVFSAFQKNKNYIDDMSALKYLSLVYKNPMITHDSVYVNIDNKNIIGGDCSDGSIAGQIVALDIIKYFNGTKVADIYFKTTEGNNIYLNEKVLNRYNLDIKDIAVNNPIIVNKNNSFYATNTLLVNSTIIIFLLMFISIVIYIRKEKELQNLNENLEQIVLDKTKDQDVLLSLFDKGDSVLFKWKNDPTWSVNYVSSSIKNLLGYDVSDFLNNKIAYATCIHEDDIARVIQEVEDNSLKGEDFFKHQHYRVVTKDQEIKWISDYTVIIRDKNNTITHYLGYINDITEDKVKDNLLFEQSKLASMGEMIGNIAHQWRQPLSIISTSATGMQMRKDFGLLTDEEFKTSCEYINTNAQYLSKTIDDFKNFIKGDRERTSFTLSQTIDTFLNIVSGSIKNYNIHIVLDLNDEIQVVGFDNELVQCLINIYNNAKDILEENNIKDKYIFIGTSKDKDNAIITIRDNAGGIPNEVLPKIFEPYFTTKHKSQGTGLGLHMTYTLIVNGMKGLMKAHNVDYKYNDTQYKCAEFIISLPLK